MGHSTRRKAQKNAHIGTIWCHSVRSRWQVLGGKRLHDLEFLPAASITPSRRRPRLSRELSRRVCRTALLVTLPRQAFVIEAGRFHPRRCSSASRCIADASGFLTLIQLL